MSGLFRVLSELTVIVGPILAKVEAGTLTKGGPWRPPEWSRGPLTAITVPGTSGAATNSTVRDAFGNPLPGAPAYKGSPPKVYVFDAVLKVEHARELRRTEHPIQASGSSPVATITDHAYQMPARVVLDIAMSDAMASFTPGAWSDKASKSISAYQALVDLQERRTLVTLTTRLATYANMLVESITPCDTAATLHGLRASVVMSQVFLADATSARSTISFGDVDSDRPQTTARTPSGVVQSTPAANSLATQYQVPATVSANTAKIPGAGNWSGLSVSRLGGLLG